MRLLLAIFLVAYLTDLGSASCPSGCRCTKKHVSCRQGHLSVFPSAFPPDTESIDMANNDFKILRNFSFKSTPHLQKLILDHNGIGRIEKDAFKGAPDIKFLYLRYNVLGTDKKHSFVNSLSILKNLHHLYLTGNNFKKIPAVMLSSMTKLNLDDNDIIDGDFPKSFLECRKLESVILSSNSISFLGSQSFKYLKPLPILNLDFEKNDISEIDKLAFDNITTLRTLTLDRNKLSHKTLASLVRAIGSAGANLNLLSVQFNAIEVLSARTFDGVEHSSMFYLRLDGNDIHQIEKNAFSPLSDSVRNLTMTNCGITTQLEHVNFGAMDSLLFLNLSMNKITVIPSSLPREVEILDMRKNDLSVIPADAFDDCRRLVHLDLRENKIHSIAENAFTSSSNIRVLNLAKNHLTRIDGRGFFGLSGLTSLDLSHQDRGLLLDNLVFKGMDRLRRLNLRTNSMSGSLANDALKPFADLRDLEDLDLRDNRLTRIGDSIFVGLTSLRTLYLSQNKLVSWRVAFDHFSNRLRHLDLSRNHLRYISVSRGASFNGLSAVIGNLDFFDASYNLFNCSCPLHPFIARIKTMGAAAKALENTRCQSPPDHLQDMLTTVAVGGRCTERPSVYPGVPAEPGKSPLSTASPEPTTSTGLKTSSQQPTKKSTASPQTTGKTITTSTITTRLLKHSSIEHAVVSRVTSKKQDTHPNVARIVGVTITVVAVIAAICGFFVYRRRRRVRSAIDNIHQKYAHLQSEDFNGTENPSLQLRDDEVSLLQDDEVGVRWTADNSSLSRQFPLLRTPLPVFDRRPNGMGQMEDVHQNNYIQNAAFNDHNHDYLRTRSIYDHSHIETDDETRDVLQPTSVIPHTNPSFIEDEVPPTSGQKQMDQSAGTEAADLTAGAESADLTAGVESADLTAGVEAADLTAGVEAADRIGGAEFSHPIVSEEDSASSAAFFQDEEEDDEAEALDMLCVCSKHDWHFVLKEVVTELRKGRYSPVIRVLRTSADGDQNRQLLHAARYLFIVNSEKLVEDVEATRMLKFCLKEVRKARHVGVILSLIRVFDDEEEHPLLAGFDDAIDKGKLHRILWRRACPGVDRSFVAKIRDVLYL